MRKFRKITKDSHVYKACKEILSVIMSLHTDYYFSSENEANAAVIEEKDLGIVFNKESKFTSHVNQIVMKTNRVLGAIKWTFTSRDVNMIRLTLI